MSIRTKSNLRGLRDIRTRSGRVDRSDVPYMAYMKVSCLEMERARRNLEKASAQARITNIDKRLEEIDVEKGGLLSRLDEPSSRGSLRSADGSNQPDQVRGESSSGFRIRY